MTDTLTCGHAPQPTEHSPGYGQDADGNTYCFDCCAERDRDQMRTNGRITLYLTGTAGEGRIINWPGTLTFHPYRLSKGKHNIARTRYDAWFNFEGEPWHGVQYGENTQLIHCKRSKVAA